MRPVPSAPDPRYSSRLFWTLQLAGWTGYAAALMVPWLGRYPLSVMWWNKLVIALTGLGTSCVLRVLYRRAARDGAGIARLIVAALSASLIGAILWNASASTILGHSLQNDSILLGALGSARWPRFDGVLYHALVLLTWSLLYLGARHYRALVAERERSLRAESLAREARLLALRYQIGPHFLFNALNAISTLVVTDRKADATAMIARLADLLRVSLEPPENGMIALRAELEIVRGYVAIERTRFADRLDVDIEADARTLDTPIPAMILQPLVENAVRHAVAIRDEPTRVTVRSVIIGETLSLAVSDDGSGSPVPVDGLGVGLANVRARLTEVYGSAHRFAAGPTGSGGFRAEIVLPLSLPLSRESAAPGCDRVLDAQFA
jgi:two-component system, LytTR family, sensor kinase